MTWEKQSPIKKDDLHIGCLTCSSAALEAPMNMVIAVGFGSAMVFKGKEIIYDEHRCEREEDYMTVADVEKLAIADPDHDWRIEKIGPLHGETFQRHAPGKWVCIESNQGFA